MVGTVIAQIRIMPEGIEVDLGKIVDEVKKLGCKGYEVKDVAFGLKAVEAIFAVPDGEGGTEEIETKLRAFPGVGSAEVINLGREIDEEF
jgi:elongation factor 1-beta